MRRDGSFPQLSATSAGSATAIIVVPNAHVVRKYNHLNCIIIIVPLSERVMDLKKHAHINKDFYVGDEAYAYDVLDIKALQSHLICTSIHDVLAAHHIPGCGAELG